jgi:hypothetical protein
MIDPEQLRRDGWDFIRSYDGFQEDVRAFEDDVHLLVLGTFDAAERHWTRRLGEELPKLETAIKTAHGEYADHLVDQHTDELARYSEQSRFALNSAVVSLVTLFVDDLRRMFRRLEMVVPRRSGRYPGKHEIARLRSEAVERFGIDADECKARLAFTAPMILARNLIVHNGGEADQEAPDGSKDQEFRNRYPDWVDHHDRVAVPEQAVRERVQAAVDFLRWIAPLLWPIELQRLAADMREADSAR